MVFFKQENGLFGGFFMETLTFFIENLFNEELGSESFQVFEKKTLTSRNYKDVVVSGSKIDQVIFENCIFENCTFWSTKISNSLFINCIFINCKFQFTEFTSCNFDGATFENCMWGLSRLQGDEIFKDTEALKNISFETRLPIENTKSLNLSEILISA